MIRMRLLKIVLVLYIVFCQSSLISGQENVVPYLYHPKVAIENATKSQTIKRTEPISLPMIETFDYYLDSHLPSDEWWIDGQVYVNNHFTNNHRNKGIATFDVIDENGQPYADTDPWIQKYCDTLTSYYIDLSDYGINDSVYLSFDYVSGGLGFKPKATDSLIVQFRDSVNGWVKVGGMVSEATMEWKTIMIPLKNENYFYDNFQFRIINKGTIGYSGAHWHIDNVLLDADRRFNDTLKKNLAFNLNPSSYLKDFTSMPWKHFITNRALFTSDSIYAFTNLQHDLTTFLDADLSFDARMVGGPLISSGSRSFTHLLDNNTIGFVNFSPDLLTGSGGIDNTLQIDFTLVPPVDDAFVLDNQIRTEVKFSNYMSYDDGSIEQAYFLNLSPGLRGEVAVEYATYVKDTLAGVQIHFVPQVPYGADKEFYIRIYKSIEVGSGEGELIYEQSGNYPIYTLENGGIVTYPLTELVPLDVGQFYVSIMMPASGISDSLMIGLDVQRNGGNHRYYNVLDTWESSLIDGAVMVRPVFGNRKLNVDNPQLLTILNIFPNPTKDKLFIEGVEEINNLKYEIFDMLGRKLLYGDASQNAIDVSTLRAGQYFIVFGNDGIKYKAQAFIKE